MTFSRPVVGPKVYLSRGTSGHSETFRRCDADAELKSLLGTVTLHIALEGFIRKMLLARKAEAWDDVTDYLSSLTMIDVEHIPLDAAVSFWAQVDQLRESIKRAKDEASAVAAGN